MRLIDGVNNTLEATALIEEISPHAYIAGGYARWAVLNHEGPRPGDIDIWLRDDKLETWEETSLALLTLGYEQRGSTSLSVSWVHKNPDYLPVQLIKPVARPKAGFTYGDPVDVIAYFDFTCTMAALISPTEAFIGPLFWEDNRHKILRIQNARSPISTVLRMMKYGAKGFQADRESVARLFDVYDQYTPEEKVQTIWYDP